MPEKEFLASFSFRLLSTSRLLLTCFHRYIESLRSKATEKLILRRSLSSVKVEEVLLLRGAGCVLGRRVLWEHDGERGGRVRRFVGLFTRRILVYIFCLINLRIALSHKANKSASLNIEWAQQFQLNVKTWAQRQIAQTSSTSKPCLYTCICFLQVNLYDNEQKCK